MRGTAGPTITASEELGRDLGVLEPSGTGVPEPKNLMKQTLFINTAIAIAAIGFSGATFAADPANSKASPANSQRSLSSADKAFMKEAAKGGMMEVAMGRVAEQNATTPEVKKFGARMVADHGKANSELKSIAAEEKVELPADKGAGKWKSDKEYMGMMVKDHEKDLAEFEKEAKNGSDADVKRFADKTSAVIRKHLQMAKDIDAKLK